MTSRPTRLESINKRFWFKHQDGHRLYPYKLTDRKTGQYAFRVAKPGTGANRNANQVYLEDVEDVVRYVFGLGWSVRMCDEKGRGDGLYSPVGRSIVATSQVISKILSE